MLTIVIFLGAGAHPPEVPLPPVLEVFQGRSCVLQGEQSEASSTFGWRLATRRGDCHA